MQRGIAPGRRAAVDGYKQRGKHVHSGRWVLVMLGGLWLLTTVTACRPGAPVNESVRVAMSEDDMETLRPQITAFCGDCHAFPPPESFPRSAWHAEVEQGFNFYRESGRHDLVAPPMNQVVAWYRAQAPEQWPIAAPPPSEPSPLRFERHRIPFPGGDFPAVSHLHWESGDADKQGVLLVSDMRVGLVSQVQDLFSNPIVTTLAEIPNPAHVTPTDLDQDGKRDFVIADLGSYQPEDHLRGRVVWLRPSADGATWETHVLVDGLSRVADIQASDFNQDGQMDLIVAEFGWRKTGRLLMLWGEPATDSLPRFRPETLDKRHGVIHVPIADLNGDQRPDIVALVSQEFETIDAFLNQADGTFERKTLYSGPEPAFGSSGIQLVDMDGDQDLDILYTNGDTLDSYFVKPTHAVHWLENLGDLKFRDHELAKLPGAYRALAGDLDGDGDLDIVACSYIPHTMLKESSADQRFDSLIWLEQREPGQFTRHSLEESPYGHMAIELGDFDRDGDLDLAVGNYGRQPPGDMNWLEVWENQGSLR
jgi:hypothetical protein